MNEVNALKAQVYDLIAEAEGYQKRVQEIQGQIGQLNEQIAKALASVEPVEAK